MSKSQFQLENDHLMKTILDRSILTKFREPIDKQNTRYYIEFNITATCNQACEYCYLTKYGDKLYPKEIRKPSLILNNMKMLINHFHEEKICPARIDLFSGEIWGTKFGDDVFNLILDSISKGLISPKLIIIPSNCSFIYNEQLRKKIDYFIDQFDKLGTRLVFSWSNDGLIVDSISRPYKNDNDNYKKTLQENYEIAFAWCKKHAYGFHPMVAASTVDKWIENYDWWIDMLNKYHMNRKQYIMTLEVRNDEWTNDHIISYLKFLNHIIDKDYNEYYKYNKEGFVNDISGYEIYNEISPGYCPYNISTSGIMEDFQCTIKESYIVRMGDLAIGPCHRTCYPEFIYGKYDTDGEKITGMTANNIQLMNRVYLLNTYSCIMCDRCPINAFCMKGCMGAQFEAIKEPLAPAPTVCEFFKAKNIFLYLKYKNNFVFNYAINENDHNYRLFTEFEKSVKQLQEDKELWNKWTTIAESIITKMQ